MAAFYNEKGRYYTLRGKYKNEFGKWTNYERTSEEFHFKRKKDADEADKILKKELSKLSNIKKKGNMTFGEVSDLYFKVMKKKNKSSTLETDKKALNKAKNLKDMQIDLITTKSIQDIIDKMDDKKHSLNYIDKVYTCIGKIFKYAIDNDIIDFNPMKKTQKITRPDAVVEDKIKYWTPSEFKTFIKTVNDSQYYALFNFLYHTGARKGEALALNWTDIDFNKKTFHINKTCTQSIKGVPFLITSPKTPNSVRTKRMGEHLTTVMKQWYDEQSKKYGFNKNCFVFGYLDKPLPTSNLERNFKSFCSFGNGWVSKEQLKHIDTQCDGGFSIDDMVMISDGKIKNNAQGYRTIKNYNGILVIDYISPNPDDVCPYHVKMPLSYISVHGLRHSHATLLINNIKNGANIKAIADRIGDTVEQLLKTYAHLFHETEDELIEIVENNF